jgi:hypothetical protein
MEAEIIGTGDARWRDFLDKAAHDFYHLPGYLDLCAGQEGGEAAAFLVEEGDAAMLAPMVLRPLPGDLEAGPHFRDAVAPYGYPSPLLKGPVDEGVLSRLLQALQETGARSGIVSAFFRLHPLLRVPEGPFHRWGTFLNHGETVYLDLERSTEELDLQARTNHRADARRLKGQGYLCQVDAWEQLDDFIAVYEETMHFRGADGFYFFDRSYYRNLRACLGDRLHLCTVLAPSGRLASGGLFTCVGGIVQFHLSGTADAFRKAGPAKLMLIHMRDWAKLRGERLLHLGGGVGCRPDSLFFFKGGFSRLRAPFSTFRMVLDSEAYQGLVRRRNTRGLAAPQDAAGFFPAYRAPLPSR